MSIPRGESYARSKLEWLYPEIRCRVASRGRIWFLARTGYGDPVELNEEEAREVAMVLRTLADEADRLDESP